MALGVVNTFTNSLFNTLIFKLIANESASTVLGYLMSLLLAFFLNCRFVFKSRPTLKKMLKFFMSYIPNFIIYFLVSNFAIYTLEIPIFWGTALAVMLAGPITFVIIKFYAFGNKNESKR